MSNGPKKQSGFGIDIVYMFLIVAVLALFWWMGTSPDQAKQLLGTEEQMDPFWQRAIIVGILFPVIWWIFKAAHR